MLVFLNLSDIFFWSGSGGHYFAVVLLFFSWLVAVSIGWRGPTLGLFCIESLRIQVSQHSSLTSTTRQGYSVAPGAVSSRC